MSYINTDLFITVQRRDVISNILLLFPTSSADVQKRKDGNKIRKSMHRQNECTALMEKSVTQSLMIILLLQFPI